MTSLHELRFPGEDETYRRAREELLRAEIDLRRQIAKVAEMKRTLPRGGRVPEDYVFELAPSDGAQGKARKIRFAELFEEGRDTLVTYSFMFAPGGKPCPMCTAMLDNLNGNARHVTERVNLAVIAKAPAKDLSRWAAERGWHDLRLLSSGGTSFNANYHAESAEGEQWPVVNVFHKTREGIHHHYCSELFFVDCEPGQQPRHVDLIWPLWNLLDFTPDGRGEDWLPGRSYAESMARLTA